MANFIKGLVPMLLLVGVIINTAFADTYRWSRNGEGSGECTDLSQEFSQSQVELLNFCFSDSSVKSVRMETYFGMGNGILVKRIEKTNHVPASVNVISEEKKVVSLFRSTAGFGENDSLLTIDFEDDKPSIFFTSARLNSFERKSK